MVELDSAGSFEEMHKAQAISMIRHGLGGASSATVGR